MLKDIKESDWKYLRKLTPLLLERACAKINLEAEALLKNPGNIDQHRLYLTLYKHYEEKDNVIADCFNDHRRSTAIYKILHLLHHEIISDAEFEGFSSETKEIIERIRSVQRGDSG